MATVPVEREHQQNQPGDLSSQIFAMVGSLQKVRRLAEILLLQWAWLQCWIGLITNICHAEFPNPDVKYSAPLLVIAVGIIATNLLGFANFYSENLPVDACMAAVDLDTPYLACKHGLQVVKGEACPEWEKLRIRNSIWRSLPLAMISFVLSMRSLVEIPSCQAFATLGPAVLAYFPELANQSSFAESLKDQDLDIFRLSILHHIRESLSLKPADKAPLVVASEMLALEREAWTAAHCKESTWNYVTLPLSEDRSQWLLPITLLYGNGGGLGSGNLAALNSLLHQQVVDLYRRKGKTLKPLLLQATKKSSWKIYLAVRVVSWDMILSQLLKEVESGGGDWKQALSLQQSRPWKAELGNAVLLEIKAGWKVRSAQTFLLMLVAVLPILKKVLEKCSVKHPVFVGIVTFYVFFDVVSLVTAFLLSATAPLAGAIGDAFESFVSHMEPVAEGILKELETGGWSTDNFKELMPKVAATLLRVIVPDLVGLTQDILPTIQWSLPLFLMRVAGSLVFVVVSAVLAVAFCGSPLVSGLSSGVCGPLWLLADNSGLRAKNLRSKGVTS